MKITIERGKKKYELLVGRSDCDPSKCAFSQTNRNGCKNACNLPEWFNDLTNKFAKGLVYPREITADKQNEKYDAEWVRGGEYEFAYCSRCGRMEFADWNTSKEADEKIGSFSKEYPYCPQCGAKMKPPMEEEW